MEAAGKKRQPEEAADEGMIRSCKVKLFQAEFKRKSGLTIRISHKTRAELRRIWGSNIPVIHNTCYSLPPPKTAPTAPVCSSDDDKSKCASIDVKKNSSDEKNKFVSIDVKKNNPKNNDWYHLSKRRHDLEVEFTGAWYSGQQSGKNANRQPLTKKVLKEQIRFLRNHFAKLALEYYNDRNKEAQFELVRGIKFFPFFGPQIDQCETEPAVFMAEWSHLNFKAKPINADSSEKKLFFAEMYNLGTDEEPMVIQCCIMDPKNSDETACGYCLGVRHPAGVPLRASPHAYGFEKLELGSLNY